MRHRFKKILDIIHAWPLVFNAWIFFVTHYVCLIFPTDAQSTGSIFQCVAGDSFSTLPWRNIIGMLIIWFFFHLSGPHRFSIKVHWVNQTWLFCSQISLVWPMFWFSNVLIARAFGQAFEKKNAWGTTKELWVSSKNLATIQRVTNSWGYLKLIVLIGHKPTHTMPDKLACLSTIAFAINIAITYQRRGALALFPCKKGIVVV